MRVPENLAKGTEILSLEAHPRNHISIMPVDKVSTLFYVFILFQTFVNEILLYLIHLLVISLISIFCGFEYMTGESEGKQTNGHRSLISNKSDVTVLKRIRKCLHTCHNSDCKLLFKKRSRRDHYTYRYQIIRLVI